MSFQSEVSHFVMMCYSSLSDLYREKSYKYIEKRLNIWLNSDGVYLQGGLINKQLVTRFEKN